jgi:hypothetical protein
MKRMASATLCVLWIGGLAVAQTNRGPRAATSSGHATHAAKPPADPADAPLAALTPDPAIAAALNTISAERVQADIVKLVSFGTRNTLSSMSTDLPPNQGVRAAAAWIEGQFQDISQTCGGCLEIKRDEFTQAASTEPGSRITKPTRLINVYAILHGVGPGGTPPDKNAPWALVTGHYDSRASDVMDPKVMAPGANDDASGVAVSLESARALSKLKLPGTMVFVAVAGEEQGLVGAKHLGRLARKEDWPLEGVLDNDIVGGDTTPGDTLQKKDVVRVFSENVPALATPEQEKMLLGIGEEGDSPSRELAREIAELAPVYFAAADHSPGWALRQQQAKAQNAAKVGPFHPVLELRHDRYLRGGDHTAFNGEGFAAVRFTEWRENYDHQHQTVRIENGKEYGDELAFVDFNYVVKVAKLNAATLASLAAAPSEPRNVRVLTAKLDNNTDLAWDAAAFAPPGTTYEVVWRDTGALLWQHAQSAGPATHLTLNVSKDNVLFGVRSVDTEGHRSVAVAPMPARQ